MSTTSNMDIRVMPPRGSDSWYVADEKHVGVWATGPTLDEALDELASVLQEWHQGGHPVCDCDMTWSGQ